MPRTKPQPLKPNDPSLKPGATEPLGDYLTRVLKALHLKKGVVGEQLGMSQQHWSDVLNNKHGTRPDKLRKFIEITGIPPARLQRFMVRPNNLKYTTIEDVLNDEVIFDRFIGEGWSPSQRAWIRRGIEHIHTEMKIARRRKKRIQKLKLLQQNNDNPGTSQQDNPGADVPQDDTGGLGDHQTPTQEHP